MSDALTAALAHWSFDPQIVLPVLLLGVLYWLGTRSTLALVPSRHRLGRRLWKAALFYTALLLVLVALESPIDHYALSLMWVHMVQHLILITLVPPLALLGDPALPLLRGVPVAARRRFLAAAMRWGWLQRVGQGLGALARPVPAFLIATFTLWSWHFPPLYNLTLRDQGVHDLEHFCFLAASTLFWWQMIDQTQFRCRQGYGRRAVYAFCTAVQNHLLAVTIALAPLPIYAYKNLAQRPGGISALVDQQLAGGFMWVPGMLIYGTAFLICMYKWLCAQNLPIGSSAVEGQAGQGLPARLAGAGHPARPR